MLRVSTTILPSLNAIGNKIRPYKVGQGSLNKANFCTSSTLRNPGPARYLIEHNSKLTVSMYFLLSFSYFLPFNPSLFVGLIWLSPGSPLKMHYSFHVFSLSDRKFSKFSDKYCDILYPLHRGIYNLGKHNSLCFGKISKFPVFSLTGNFFWPPLPPPKFPVFPVQWVPCVTVVLCNVLQSDTAG